MRSDGEREQRLAEAVGDGKRPLRRPRLPVDRLAMERRRIVQAGRDSVFGEPAAHPAAVLEVNHVVAERMGESGPDLRRPDRSIRERLRAGRRPPDMAVDERMGASPRPDAAGPGIERRSGTPELSSRTNAGGAPGFGRSMYYNPTR